MAEVIFEEILSDKYDDNSLNEINTPIFRFTIKSNGIKVVFTTGLDDFEPDKWRNFIDEVKKNSGMPQKITHDSMYKNINFLDDIEFYDEISLVLKTDNHIRFEIEFTGNDITFIHTYKQNLENSVHITVDRNICIGALEKAYESLKTYVDRNSDKLYEDY